MKQWRPDVTGTSGEYKEAFLALYEHILNLKTVKVERDLGSFFGGVLIN